MWSSDTGQRAGGGQWLQYSISSCSYKSITHVSERGQIPVRIYSVLLNNRQAGQKITLSLCETPHHSNERVPTSQCCVEFYHHHRPSDWENLHLWQRWMACTCCPNLMLGMLTMSIDVWHCMWHADRDKIVSSQRVSECFVPLWISFTLLPEKSKPSQVNSLISTVAFESTNRLLLPWHGSNLFFYHSGQKNLLI